MSATILKRVFVDQIQAELPVAKNLRWIDARPNPGKPISSNVPDIYVAVHSGGWQQTGITSGGMIYGGGRELDNGHCEEFNIDVTVSIRMTPKHTDFWGIATNETTEMTLEYTVRSIINCIHLQPGVLTRANGKLFTGNSSPFVEMMRMKKVDAEVERGLDWWGTDTTAKSKNTNTIYGYSQAIHFTGGKRVQGIGNYT